MYKFFIGSLLLIAFSSTALLAQPPAVLGVPFGSSFEDTEQILDKRFTKKSNLGKTKLFYEDIEMGGFLFDIATFYFNEGTKGSYLTFVNINRSFLENKEKAIEMRNGLLKYLKQKYPSIISKKIDGFICYTFGHDPANHIGSLTIHKIENSYGKIVYHLDLNYNPIEFQASDF